MIWRTLTVWCDRCQMSYFYPHPVPDWGRIVERLTTEGWYVTEQVQLCPTHNSGSSFSQPSLVRVVDNFVETPERRAKGKRK